MIHVTINKNAPWPEILQAFSLCEDVEVISFFIEENEITSYNKNEVSELWGRYESVHKAKTSTQKGDSL